MVTHQEAAELFFGGGSGERHYWGTVASVNPDGTLEVRMNPSVATTCATLCSCSAGDRVLVLVMDGSATVLGRKVG